LSDAARLTEVVPDGGDVVMVKLAVVAPAGTVTLAGTLAVPGSWLDRSTGTPGDGAALASVTVPVADWPPATVVGLTVYEERTADGGGAVAGVTVMFAVCELPPKPAEIVEAVAPETSLVATTKLA
jgi:hypothetical protein